MILQQYIQEVLFKQRVCVVPQLGTFSVQHFPALYNQEAQTLTAPREQVMFTQQWQDDGSCVEWIALKENLVPAVAQRKLDKYLEELKAGLKSGAPLVLPGIGRLQGDFTGNIHFHAEELPLQRETLELTPVARASANTAAPVQAQPAEILEPIMTEEVENTLEAVTADSGFKWWWAGIPIAMIIAGLAAWWYVSHQAANAPATTAAVADTASQQAIAPAADSLQQAADSMATAVAAPAPVNYFVVVKQFADSTKAVAYQKQQKVWGREVVIYKKDSLYKTAVALPPAADTTNELNAVKKIFGNGVYLDAP